MLLPAAIPGHSPPGALPRHPHRALARPTATPPGPLANAKAPILAPRCPWLGSDAAILPRTDNRKHQTSLAPGAPWPTKE